MRRKTHKISGSARAAFMASGCAVGLLLLSGCSNNIQVRGNLPDPEIVGEIETGVHSRRQVAERLGSPSAISTFEDRKWYYVGQKTTQFAFFEPEVLERNVLVVTFDGTGKVDETKAYTLADGQVVDVVSRTTPTEGRELTLLQQIFGNLGSNVPGSILGGGTESQRPR
ncbi:outer membrane protein assembly factor BamE [Denitrobaculum tricleocarpae]|uniref:Outer membrane protein assembly factor BamE n=1 Tax=Denitrobaculum tricleocarpae TaxID=2591009 RepID=A0A545TTD5_9PROT|nr:outer membrane protein assembly factor BamE [Denitrobaculum tricleocarpae]TQV80475.1 outer membrane protein assembly factor BamE [Denitrobaculum tricleocarpae]